MLFVSFLKVRLGFGPETVEVCQKLNQSKNLIDTLISERQAIAFNCLCLIKLQRYEAVLRSQIRVSSFLNYHYYRDSSF